MLKNRMIEQQNNYLIFVLIVISFIVILPQSVFSAVSNFRASPSINSVSLSWTRESGYSYTLIEMGGATVYDSSGTSCSVSDLEMGREYSFTATPYKIVDGSRVYSSSSYIETKTRLGGTIESSMTITGDHLVQSTLTVPDGMTLTVSSATLQFMSSSTDLTVNGELDASSSTFTSDDEIKAANQWGSIIFNDGSSGMMQHCVIECAGANPIAAGFDSNSYAILLGSSSTGSASLVFENCTIQYMISDNSEDRPDDGIRVFGQGSSLTVRNSLFSNIAGNAIYIYNDNYVNIESNEFDNCAIPVYLDHLKTNFPIIRSNVYKDNNFNGIQIDSTETASGTWYEDTLIEGEVNFDELTISQGVSVYFQSYLSKISINSNLIAEGVSNNPIHFTSDDEIKAANQWGSIIFNDGSSGMMQHCVIECAGANPIAAGFDSNSYAILLGSSSTGSASLVFENCTIQYMISDNSEDRPDDGIRVFGQGSSLTVRNSLFSNIAGNAIYIYNDNYVNIESNEFDNCAIPVYLDHLKTNFPIIRSNVYKDNNFNGIQIDSTETASGTWYEDTLIEGEVNFDELTISQGVSVYFQSYLSKISINSNLIAEGVSNNPIHFTSDDEIKAANQWGSIIFNDGSSGVMQHCVIECAGANPIAAGFDSNSYAILLGSSSTGSASLVFENSTIQYMISDNNEDRPDDGIYVASTNNSLILKDSILTNIGGNALYFRGSTLSASGNYFYQNGSGIRLIGDISPVISYNYFDNSTTPSSNWALTNSTGNIITAQNCWWGDPTGPFDDECNMNGQGDKVSPCSTVHFDNYLTSMPADYLPGSINNLSVSWDSGSSAHLAWTASGDNGIIGQADSYIVKINNRKITPSNWNSSTTLSSPPVPGASGWDEMMTVTNLDTDTQYFFAIRSMDAAGNLSGISNVAILSPLGSSVPIQLVSPNGRETLTKDTETLIQWHTPEEMDHIRLAYNRAYNGVWDEGTQTVITSSTSDDGEEGWTPNFVDGSVWVRVEALDREGRVIGRDISQYPFAVNAPDVVDVTSPAPTQVLGLNESFDIEWDYVPSGGHAAIYYMTQFDGFWKDENAGTITTNTANDGSYSWTPDFEAHMLYIKVVAYDSNGNPAGYDIAGPFQIRDESNAVVLHGPNSGIFFKGGRLDFSWSVTGSQSEDLIAISMKRLSASDMTEPDGINYHIFTETAVNDGFEAVIIPDTVAEADDWHFCVRHVATGDYDCSNQSATIYRSGDDPNPSDGGISGQVFDAEGNPIEGLEMTLSGDASGTDITDSNGYFHFDIAQAGSYVIQPPQDGSYYPQNESGVSAREIDITDTGYGVVDVNFTTSSEMPSVKVLFPRSGDKLSGDFAIFGTAFVHSICTSEDCRIDTLDLIVDGVILYRGTLLGGRSQRFALSQVVWRDFSGEPVELQWSDLLVSGSATTLQIAAHNSSGGVTAGWGISNSVTVSLAQTSAYAKITFPQDFSPPVAAPQSNITLNAQLNGATASSKAWYMFRNENGIEWDGKSTSSPITENYPSEDIYPVACAIQDTNGNTMVDVELVAVYRPAYKGNPSSTRSGSYLGGMGANVVSGNFYYQTTDFTLNGVGTAFNFWRRYNSLSYKGNDPEISGFGKGGWGHAWEYTIFTGKAGRRLYLAMPDGHWERYAYIDGNWKTMVPGATCVIAENPANFGFIVIDRNQTVYNFNHYIPSQTHGGIFRPTAITDKNGNTTTLVYDLDDRLTSIIDTLPTSPRPIDFTYNTQGYISEISDGTGRSVSYSYDTEGYLTSFTDRRGKTWHYGYSAFGTKKLLTTIADPLSHTLLTNHYSDSPSGDPASWDGEWRLVSQTDALNNQWKISYNSAYETIITNPDQGSTTYDINESHMVSDIINPGNGQTSTAYRADITAGNIRDTSSPESLQTPRFTGTSDKTEIGYTGSTLGNPTAITDLEDRVTSITWEEDPTLNKNLVSAFHLPGTTLDYEIEYDERGNTLSVTDPEGRVSTYTYNEQGQMLTHTDPLGFTITNIYDDQGYLIEKRYGSSSVNEEFSYDTYGRLESFTDKNGNTTSYSYNENDQITVVEDPYANTLIHTYDDAGNRISTTDKRGSTANFHYNAANLLDTMEKSDGQGNTYTVVYSYDGLQRVISVLNARGNRSLREFTSKGEIEKSINPSGQYIFYDYDADSNISNIEYRDAQGSTQEKITYTRDKLGRVTSESRTVGTSKTLTTAYTYNALGKIETITNPKQFTTTYTYDQIGRLTGTDQNGITANVAYDESKSVWTQGLRKVVTDSEGSSVEYCYDTLSRLLRKRDSLTKAWEFTYDNNGNMTSYEDARSRTTRYTYDMLNRLTEVTYPDSSSVSYTYDENGNPLTMTDQHGTTTMSYDNLNRLISRIDSFGKTVSYEYDGNNNITELIYPGNKTVRYDYDEDDRMVSLIDWLNNTTTYGYDAANHIVSILHGNGTEVDINFDSAGRMTNYRNIKSDNTVIAEYDYQLDDNGNRLSGSITQPILPAVTSIEENYTYDQVHRITSGPGATFTHDDNGNIISEVRDGITTDYEYDYRDSLVSWDNGTNSFIYRYSGAGNRISSTIDGVETRYVLDTNRTLPEVLARTNSSGTVQDYYVYGASGLVNRITPDDSSFTYHFDATGNTVAITDSSEDIVNSYGYTPYGKVTSNESIENPFEFSGQYGVMAEENGLNYMRARFYHPEIRRFISQDRLWGDATEPLSLNLYAYVQGNPMMRVDPSGLTSDSRLNHLGVVCISAFGVVSNVSSCVGKATLAGGGYASLNFIYGTSMTLGALTDCNNASKDMNMFVASVVNTATGDETVNYENTKQVDGIFSFIVEPENETLKNIISYNEKATSIASAGHQIKTIYKLGNSSMTTIEALKTAHKLEDSMFTIIDESQSILFQKDTIKNSTKTLALEALFPSNIEASTAIPPTSTYDPSMDYYYMLFFDQSNNYNNSCMCTQYF